MTKVMSHFLVGAVITMVMFTFSAFGLTQSASAATLVSPEALQAGDLIRGESYSAVYYYGTDGFRYVFPNDKTYFTWYSNFDSVKWVSDANMSTIQIGGNVTYRPGVRMIKINSDSKTYAVGKGGTLKHVTSEAVAIALYGSNWNKMIDDVPDGFFGNYKMGGGLDLAISFSVTGETADALNINTDKMLQSSTKVTVSSMGFSPASITVKAGTAVRFTNTDSASHSASADDDTWGTGTLASGNHFSRYFKKAGTYTYHDANGTAKSTITVE